ncbi:MAG: UDP-N-acetylmuramyl-tripeptide synthetase [Candidatus Falkowbacteria bacterium]|nr:UDP-N-acetylmuramyl-tripeptide synthetase [Candidatus Falkowbacteria bacterium]
MLSKIKKLIPRQLFKAIQPVYHFILSFAAVLFHGFPSDRLIVIGITGTTGKTSTVYLLARALQAMGYKVGYTSTAMFSDGNKEWLNDKKMTMVGRFFTQRMIRRMSKNGCEFAIIESTSEGIRQFRHRFINFDALLFTGLYPEHLESHGTFDNYKATKGRLFGHLQFCHTKYIDDQKKVVKPKSELQKLGLNRVKKTIIVNGDDENAPYFSNFWSERKIAFTNGHPGENELANFSEIILKDLELLYFSEAASSAAGASFNFFDLLRANSQDDVKPEAMIAHPVELKLLGVFNAQNSVAALAVCAGLDLSLEKAQVGLEEVSGLVGKMEKIDAGQDFTVLVDYAFEPRALEKLYDTMSLIPHQRTINVLGSTGGGRDASRRPILGKIAGERADLVIVTNEDPYDDDPQEIIDQVAAGAESVGKSIGEDLLKILDRREAIRRAFEEARTGDLVLITGKGGEQFICAKNGEKIPWDDRLVAKEELNALGS